MIDNKGKGFATYLETTCTDCKNVNGTYTSHTEESKKKGPRPFQINKDIVAASMLLDMGASKLNDFCQTLNLPSLHHKTFNNKAKTIQDDSAVMKEDVLQTSAEVVRSVYNKDKNDTSPLDIAVSFDNTWMTRGHTSLIGLGTVIEVKTGLVLDLHVVSKFCQTCATTGAIKMKGCNTHYEKWLENHKKDGCSINYEGVSGMMEPECAEVMWKRSVSLHNMRYTTMVGDGDSKAYDTVCNVKPYGNDVIIEKEECMNHISKRLGSALRNLVSDMSKKGVTLGGKKPGSLTANKIRKLGIYFARAIRSNSTAEGMKQAILASLHHNYSTDDNPRHMYCPPGESSWCFFKKDIANHLYPGGHAKRIHTPLDYDRLHKYLEPIYNRLTDPKLLKRCELHSTQNANESLHNSIWSRCSKSKFHSLEKVRFAATIAISEFNFGTKYIKRQSKFLGTTFGENSKRLSRSKSLKRLQRTQDISTGKDQERRKKRKDAAKKAEEECLQEHGHIGYAAGEF